MISQLVNKVFRRLGYVPKSAVDILPVDLAEDTEFMKLYEQCKPYTMTSAERLYGLYKSVIYIIDNNIAGDFVECGVWKGGSSMMIALCLKLRNVQNRKIYLYDTFEGMSKPSVEDKSFLGEEASMLLDKEDPNVSTSVWCVSSIDEVKSNLSKTNYPSNLLHFIQGKVEDTLPTNTPGPLALLRLDTDWYESTKIEMELLFPLLNLNGILIIDDFGHWQGAKKAVLEYFARHNVKPFLHRLDYTGRLYIKQ